MTISVFASLKSPVPDSIRRAILTGAILVAAALPAWSAEPEKAGSLNAPFAPKLAFKQTEAESGLAIRVIGGLLFVVIVGYGAVYVLKRYVPGVVGQTAGGARRINILETRRLTPKTALYLIEVDGVQLLLSQSADKIETVHRFSANSAPRPGINEHRDV